MAQVFECLDADGDGEVNRDEFLQGCARLRSDPKTRDVNRIPIYIQSLAARIEWYEQKVDALVDEVLVVLERKMRENGVEANHFKRRQGVSLFIRAPITLIRIAADWVQGIDMRALEALRKEASKRGVHDDRN
ncbi:hypothetical protein Pmar_PMAR017919, partial [Perkinsus marinus ATCC 50983]